MEKKVDGCRNPRRPKKGKKAKKEKKSGSGKIRPPRKKKIPLEVKFLEKKPCFLLNFNIF
ncbi:hypothetical protein ISU91_17285 [Leptospira borgpetersenii serovar Hardjo-bovis]|nr:hypothetical protein [Leptospira borgpetersenii serovar Hardjo-bovis]